MPIELVDCHTHTVFSDGKSTFQENMQEALAKGITTIACTDHWGRPDFIDCSIEEGKLKQYAFAIERVRNEFPELEIVHGLEADWYPAAAPIWRKHVATQRSFLDPSTTFKKKRSTGMKTCASGKSWGQTSFGGSTLKNGARRQQAVCSIPWRIPTCRACLAFPAMHLSLDLAPLFDSMAQAAARAKSTLRSTRQA